MSAKSIRILKEARILFWPWLAVILAGVLRLVDTPLPEFYRRRLFTVHNFIEPLSFLGFFIGIPLLATLSLGTEFQHRTLALLLSQPIRRMEIWSEKFSVTIIAVVSAALVFCWTWRASFHEDRELWVGAAALIIIMTASAPFWTLIARSTLGGLALNSVNSFIPLVMTIRRDWIPQTTITRSFAVFALLCYAATMLWLGRRIMARFQLTGGIAGDDLLTSGPDFMPSALADWFRSRPTGLFLNLLRKEFRLLRPVWLLSLLGLVAWFCVPAFRSTPEHSSIPALLMITAFTPLIAVLAGTLSLGEERSSGTHVWHLTLPVSAARLWLIKLSMALFTSFFCALLLPALAVIAGKLIFRSPLSFTLADSGILWVIAVLLLTFASFWCACSVNGTVSATLCVFPVLVGLVLAGQFGDWVALKSFNFGQPAFVFSRLGLFANFRFTNAVSNLDPSRGPDGPFSFLALLVLPALLFAIFQSSRLFRKQLQESKLFVLRRLLPLAIIAFLCAFSLVAFYAFVFDAKRSMWTMFKETHEAIENLQPSFANQDADHPLQLTFEDLAKVSPLSERTQRWLRNSQITVTPVKPHFDRHYFRGTNSDFFNITPDKPHPWYIATIQLPSGSNCTVSFRATPRFGILGGVCK
jgi:ABC-type transport system involved in multi-copper enzyme maturation permease subunit